jgi:hypothetical protein
VRRGSRRGAEFNATYRSNTAHDSWSPGDGTHRLANAIKTAHLYSMGSRLVNVRLDHERLRKARNLREAGVSLSDVVREAIDTRFQALRQRRLTGREAVTRVAHVLEDYPDAASVPARSYDVHDASQARAAIARRLGRRSR